MRKHCLACLLLLGLLLSTSLAQAIMVGGGTSTSGLGSFMGYLWYIPASDTEAQLYLVLANTTPPEAGGYITGIALNNPRNTIQTVTAAELPKGFALLGAEPFDTIKAQPFGYFDFGAALGGNFLGGGSPVLGLPAIEGQNVAQFVFNLTGTGLLALTEGDFVQERSRPQGSKQQGFLAVRFKGFVNGGSDKVLSASWVED